MCVVWELKRAAMKSVDLKQNPPLRIYYSNELKDIFHNVLFGSPRENTARLAPTKTAAVL